MSYLRRLWVWLFGAQGFDFVELLAFVFPPLVIILGSVYLLVRFIWKLLH